MPTYGYTCECYLNMLTRICPIEERDKQTCNACGKLLKRKWVFEGSVWAPSVGGFR